MLKEKIKIKNIDLDGRIVMPPVATYQCDDDGIITEAVYEYYGKRAANPNVSLIITEHNYITLQGKARKKQMSIASDICIEGHKKLVDTIHRNGAKAFIQLNHAGGAALNKVSGMCAVAPSPIRPSRVEDDTEPLELTKEKIDEIVREFAMAAKRAKEAGYDGVEIHSAHAYLLNQFYSPLTNKRTDEYGGSLENRLRIHKEVIRAVRATVGDEYLIAVRLGAADYMEGGNTILDGAQAAKILEAEGIDLLDITGGICRYTRNDCSEAGYFQDASKAIKKAVSIPIILTGGVTTLKEAETLLENGASDLIGVGRELFKNPNWEI